MSRDVSDVTAASHAKFSHDHGVISCLKTSKSQSMGGAVAFLACKKKPSLFEGCVFVAPMCKISDSLKPPKWVIDLLEKITGPVGTNGYFGYLPIAPTSQDLDNLTHRDIIMRDLCCSVPFLYGRNPRLTTARELLAATLHISSDLHTFTKPFLVQHGKDDKVTDPTLSQELYDCAKSKDKTIKLYDGMWHAILADVPHDTENVLNDTIQWLLKRI
jgi:acylglycerol lipase